MRGCCRQMELLQTTFFRRSLRSRTCRWPDRRRPKSSRVQVRCILFEELPANCLECWLREEGQGSSRKAVQLAQRSHQPPAGNYSSGNKKTKKKDEISDIHVVSNSNSNHNCRVISGLISVSKILWLTKNVNKNFCITLQSSSIIESAN